MIKIEDYLRNYSNKTIYYCPNPGNAGDALIALATYQLFKRLGINYKIAKPGGDDLRNKVVFYGGGGQLVNIYNGYAIKFLLSYKDVVKKLVVLPHTINLEQSIIKSFDNNVDVMCRERISLEYVKKNNQNVNTYIFDDLVFSMNLVEVFNKKIEASLYTILDLKHLYHYIKFLVNKTSTHCKIFNSFRTDLEKSELKLPKYNYDVSSEFGALIFNEKLSRSIGYHLLNFINQFRVINTNRLHIAISGAVLGKEVNFYQNSYWKNKAVYDFSMKTQYPNVIWKGNSI